VGLIDADICGPSIHLFFKNSNYSIPTPGNSKIKPANFDGINFVSSAFYAPGGAFIRAPRATGMLKGFFEDFDWNECDVIIVDLPPGTGDIQLSLIQEINITKALCVTTPCQLSVEDTAKSMTQWEKGGVPILGVIENFSFLDIGSNQYFPFGQGGAEELSSLFNVPILAKIPQFIDKTCEEEVFSNYLFPVFQKMAQEICLPECKR
jgi:ATP-binding protein involved in chromosome partitioning